VIGVFQEHEDIELDSGSGTVSEKLPGNIFQHAGGAEETLKGLLNDVLSGGCGLCHVFTCENISCNDNIASVC
jgi:hypothetical protein